jgi:hypothetical protein
MASVIRIKRSEVNGNPASLCAGELAYSGTGAGTSSNGEDRLYIGLGTETAGNAANHIVIGGKYFTDMMDHTRGTLTANSALIVDANSKLDNLKVDNLDLNGNTISSLDTNGNIVLDPNGTGYVTITGTNALILPVGTTAQRAPNVQGGVRFNTTTSSFEGFDGANWGSLGGVKDVDQDTYIIAETSAGNDDDTLTFTTAGVTRATLNTTLDISSTVDVQINNTTQSTSTTTGALVIDGGVGIAKNLYIGGNIDVAGTMQFDGGANFEGNVTISGSDDPGEEFFTIENATGVDKFVVDSATGNTTIAGSLSVNGIDITGAVGAGGDLSTDANLIVDGNTTLGDANDDTITFNAKMATSILVDTDSSYDLGSTAARWANIYVDAATITNNVSIGGTLSITGETTLASATVSDLTAGRVTYAGVGGSLVDSGNLTFSGTELGVTGTLDVSGEATLGSAIVEDLTATRLVYVGTGGALVDSANLTFTGSELDITGTLDVSGAADIGGDFSVATNKFTVAATTGNTAVGGTLSVTGNTTLTGTLTAQNTAQFNQSVTVSGATALNGGLTMDTNKFVVADTTGNTTIAGTLDVDGAVNFNSSLTVDGSVDIGSTSSTVDIEASTLAIDSTDTTNLTMTANSVSNKVLSIDAANEGTGEAVINVGSTLTDLVKIDSATRTTIESDSEVEINAATVDINATGDVTIDSTGGDITLTAGGAVIQVDTLELVGEGGAGNNVALSIEGSLDVDNIKLDGNTISTTDGSNVLYIDPNPAGAAGDVIIEGNLTVNGTQTTINSTTVTIDDPIFVLGGDSAPTSDDNLDRGIEFQWYDTVADSAKVGFFGFDDSTSEFTFIPDATDTASVISGTAGNVKFGKGNFIDTTQSTGTGSGAVTVAGGVGIAGQLNVGGATNKFTATTASTSTTTGAVVVGGGMGVADTIYVGNDIIGAGYATSRLDAFEIDGGTY